MQSPQDVFNTAAIEPRLRISRDGYDESEVAESVHVRSRTTSTRLAPGGASGFANGLGIESIKCAFGNSWELEPEFLFRDGVAGIGTHAFLHCVQTGAFAFPLVARPLRRRRRGRPFRLHHGCSDSDVKVSDRTIRPPDLIRKILAAGSSDRPTLAPESKPACHPQERRQLHRSCSR